MTLWRRRRRRLGIHETSVPNEAEHIRKFKLPPTAVKFWCSIGTDGLCCYC